MHYATCECAVMYLLYVCVVWRIFVWIEMIMYMWEWWVASARIVFNGENRSSQPQMFIDIYNAMPPARHFFFFLFCVTTNPSPVCWECINCRTQHWESHHSLISSTFQRFSAAVCERNAAKQKYIHSKIVFRDLWAHDVRWAQVHSTSPWHYAWHRFCNHPKLKCLKIIANDG